ncbi:hypothetical protein RHSIM_Rhsim11G0102800 [Rhododendron simsii]|uniref:Uncharacterized protein n=1 Tax=Rhododendron simsii TaxID=118357 RepID=A0A834G8G3_RHOSS|nr:hypothetical protein RHSIM_Rhsim11G0102800 [Rhododendron simsii]
MRACHVSGHWPSNKLQVYVYHLEQKIDLLTKRVENDKTVREELVEIKRLLHLSSNGSRGKRSRDSPLRNDGHDGPEVYFPRTLAKDRIAPPLDDESIGGDGRPPRDALGRI